MLSELIAFFRSLFRLRPTTEGSVEDSVSTLRKLLGDESRGQLEVWHYFMSPAAGALAALGRKLQEQGWDVVAIYPDGMPGEFTSTLCLCVRRVGWYAEASLCEEIELMLTHARSFGLAGYAFPMVAVPM